MNQSWQWKEEDIFRLIADKVEENINLDYKACDSLGKTDGKKNDISKDVSAFANSAGGTIVYGILEDKHVPTRVDVGYDPREITKEWLEQVINSKIQRRIDGIRINPVALNESQPGKVLYVVSIPQSTRSPHMASDHRFYKRYNFESIPMEEYEVRDVTRRQETPDLHLTPFLALGTRVAVTFGEGEDYSNPIDLDMRVENKAAKPAEYIVIEVFIDSRLKIVSMAEFSNRHKNLSILHELADPNTPINILMMNWAVPGKVPVWEGVSFRLTTESLQIAFPREPGDYLLAWQLRSPGMAERQNFYSLTSTGSSLYIVDKSNQQVESPHFEG
jgi:hypothetical protein